MNLKRMALASTEQFRTRIGTKNDRNYWSAAHLAESTCVINRSSRTLEQKRKSVTVFVCTVRFRLKMSGKLVITIANELID